MKAVAFYGSIREKGNSEILAEIALQNINVKKIFLRDHHILPIDDTLHQGSRTASQTEKDEYPSLIHDQLEADIFVFVTPVYWYGLSSLLKTYIDRWSESLRNPEIPDFKERMRDKKNYLITVGGDQPRVKALPIIQQMTYICDFFQMEFSGYVIGEGDKKGEILADHNAVQQADYLNKCLKAMITG
ncbi:MAG: flavodoxin family protein [Sporolactobacillus sp.]